VRADDVVARFGGDEFVVLQLGLAQPRGAKVLADRLIRILSAPYDIGGTSLNCGVTIGIAVAPTDADNWDQLLSRADAALYKAKDGGRNSVCFFTSGMGAIFKQRTNLEVELRRALESKSFNLAYQPLFSFHDESLTGFECLLRWPQNWLFRSPADFIPVAEESGLIVPIGEWILITACRTAAAWDNHLKIAVNISPVQFRQGDLVGIVERALAISGLVPNRLELEVTESLWLQDSDTVLDQLSRLRSLGVSIALDDFGTGYSSLAYLWRFPFDKVKIDRSFVAAIQSDPKALAIVQTIVAMAKALNLTVTAEGVETEEQARALREAGCDQVQGFFYGRPLSLAVAEEIVEIQSQLRRSLRLARNT
jgi:predicted signal transduction protein with EAL and GGDEF domain